MAQFDPEKQRGFAVEAVRMLRQHGFEAYWAGGCVRDQLLGRHPKDYDVATNARPDEIRHVFGNRRTLAIGAAFGVMAVNGPPGAGQIEVVTFRQDEAYSDSRHPDAVTFSTPEADAQRRDFTINGLFFDPIDEVVIDFVGGQEDLERRVVRAIGDPRARFDEDKLRLLRAVRFAATFGFELEAETRAAIAQQANGITLVSAERIAAEIRVMLVDENRGHAVELLRELGLLDAILPELSSHSSDHAWTVALSVLRSLVDPSFGLALAALLHTFVDVAGSHQVARRWKLSNHEAKHTAWLLEHQDALRSPRSKSWPSASKLRRLLVSPGIHDLLALHEAIAAAVGHRVDGVEHCRKLLELPHEQLDPHPLLTGDDLIEHGVPRGPHYQRLLETVRDAQLEHRIHTKQEALALVDQLLVEWRHEGDLPS